MNLQALCERWKTLRADVASSLMAARSVVRGLPLFLAARPKTPLRVLCIIAFDTLHRLRHATPLPTPKRRTLAALLDFGACANAAFDRKAWCRHEWRSTLRLLEDAGIGSSVAEYLRRLRELESRRPLPGGDDGHFQEVGCYREAVVRLSLGMAAATADGNPCLDEGFRGTYRDADFNILFRIAMQCQIIDDVWDYAKDRSAGLPSFLTASGSLPRALELTRLAALDYAGGGDWPPTGAGFPLRTALFLVSTCAKLVIAVGRWRHQRHPGRQVAGIHFVRWSAGPTIR